ncbi:MAG: hypothetical protein MMC23_006781 [Stictis urceolatum]|nr:hypothetical protein [Stictis urceolata]
MGHMKQLDTAENCSELNGCFLLIWSSRACLIVICVLNVISDLGIFGLAIYAIQGVQIKRAQKLGITLIFGLVLGTVALDIARTVENVDTGPGSLAGASVTWILELWFSVLASCLLTYRILIGWKAKNCDRSREVSNPIQQHRLYAGPQDSDRALRLPSHDEAAV